MFTYDRERKTKVKPTARAGQNQVFRAVRKLCRDAVFNVHEPARVVTSRRPTTNEPNHSRFAAMSNRHGTTRPVQARIGPSPPATPALPSLRHRDATSPLLPTRIRLSSVAFTLEIRHIAAERHRTVTNFLYSYFLFFPNDIP